MGSRKFRLALAIFGMIGLASAQTSSPNAALEIDSLFKTLESSGCEFYRNGSWYSASKANEHLKRKYEYLTKRRLADTAELFIARAATESSISGKPYKVRCPGQPTIDSKVWFQDQLQRYRNTHGR